MAITLADFTKIWASTSPLTPYTFSESNYKEGWNFIGGTPPSRQMWDSVQKQNDEKLKYIVDNFLPLDGGTMTGAIVLADGGNPLSTAGGTMTGGIEYKGTNNEPFFFGSYGDGATFGWDFNSATGSGIGLYNVSRSADAGAFNVWAKDGSNSASLVGKPDGTLTWDNKEVERVNASGSNYIRYENGLQICWGDVQATSSGTRQTFGKPFSGDPMVVVSANGYNIGSGHENESSTGFNATTNQSSGAWVSWIAIGKWK